MVSDKPLKETDIGNIAKVDRKYYLINKEKQTLIKIPKKVLNALLKMNTSEKGGLAADSLAMAIAYRRSKGIINELNSWISEGGQKSSKYPICEANKMFTKFLSSILNSQLLDGYFTYEEVSELELFFAKCPHGYEPYNQGLIAAHHEFKPVLT
ncbi:hypothetical protein [Neobacillus sp. FSL H8-0543]|uniref:hypothetical protein n=1 Tax=Neobacillus sp. FSL H8-0543 TaxID=2954672 RepID=UPI00315892BE